MMSKVIAITGAGSGLGRALARKFGGDGEQVVLLARTFAKVVAVASELGANALPLACDIGNPQDVARAFARIGEVHGKLDVLINNAAMIDYATLAAASDEHILGTVNTNLVGNLLCSRAALNMMGRGGHIINVTSESVEAPYPHHVVYQATKGGVECMARHLQNEVEPLGIRVSVVRAGPMYDADQKMQAGPEAAQGFYRACVERGIDLSRMPVSHFDSVLWVFRTLIDMPADMHVDTMRFTSRQA